MANVRNGNTFYIDTVFASVNDGTELLIKNIRVTGLMFTTAGTGGKGIVLADAVTGMKKLAVYNVNANDTKDISLWESDIVFPNGIRVLTLDTGCVCTCLVTESRG